MKKLLVASVLALAATVACQQKASAWSEFKFSAGVNLGWVGGGNRILWGACHSAPYPGGQDVEPLVVGNVNYPAYGVPAPAIMPGAPIYQGPPPHPVAPPPPPASPAATGLHSFNNYYNPGYQPVSYYPGAYYQQAPSYWYGR